MPPRIVTDMPDRVVLDTGEEIAKTPEMAATIQALQQQSSMNTAAPKPTPEPVNPFTATPPNSMPDRGISTDPGISTATSTAPMQSNGVQGSIAQSGGLTTPAVDKKPFSNRTNYVTDGVQHGESNGEYQDLSGGGNPPVPTPTIPTPVGPQIGTFRERSETTTQKKYDPALLKQIDEKNAEAANQTRKAGAAQAELARQAGEEAGKKAAVQDQMAQDRINEQANQKRMFGEYQTQTDKLYKEIADTEIKPKEIFESGNLGQNVTAGLAIAMGAFGAALLGQANNPAMDIINKAIDRDLDAQKANLGKKKDQMNMLGLRYQAARQAGYDDLNARLMAKGDSLLALSEYAKQKAATANSDMAKANAEATAAKLEAEGLKAKADATAKQSQITEKSEQKQLKTDGMGMLEVPSDRQKEILGATNSIKSAKALRDVYSLRDMGGAVEGRILALKNKFGLTAADEADFVAKVNSLAEKVLHQLSGTAASADQAERIRSFSADLISNPEAAIAKLDSFIEEQERDLQTAREGYGVGPDGRAKNFIFPSTAGMNDKKKKVGFE